MELNFGQNVGWIESDWNLSYAFSFETKHIEIDFGFLLEEKEFQQEDLDQQFQFSLYFRIGVGISTWFAPKLMWYSNKNKLLKYECILVGKQDSEVYRSPTHLSSILFVRKGNKYQN